MAKEVSKGPGASDGGDLGWLRRGTIQKLAGGRRLRAEGRRGVASWCGPAPGSTSSRWRSGAGAAARASTQAKDEIRDRLSRSRPQAYREQYLAELKRDAVIDYRIPELKELRPRRPAAGQARRPRSPSASATPPASAPR